jgi:hypothetical protein
MTCPPTGTGTAAHSAPARRLNAERNGGSPTNGTVALTERDIQLRAHRSPAAVVKLQPHASGGDLRLREGGKVAVSALHPVTVVPGQSQDGTSPSGKGAFGVTS